MRIFIWVTVFLIGALFAYSIYDSGAAAAIRQFFTWVIAGIQKVLITLVSGVSKVGGAYLQRTFKKGVMRQLLKPFWTILIVLAIRLAMTRVSKMQVYRRLAWVEIKRVRFIQTLKRVWRYNPELPMIVRVFIVGAALTLIWWGITELNERFGMMQSIAFSIAAFWILEKTPFLGFDVLLKYISKEVDPVREFFRRFAITYPRATYWLSWLVMAPLVQGIKKRLLHQVS